VSRPSQGAPFVVYRLATGTPNAGQARLAICVRLQADDTADLFVFGRPADGAPFAGGPAYVVNVPRSQGAAVVNNTWSVQGAANIQP
jgi:hypothetical protein